MIAPKIKQTKPGTAIDEINLNILLYSINIILTAEREINLQKMLNTMSLWCN